ncbi:phosphodiester glycosidase family protein [Pararhizobium antarcticum]|uniref:Phosphodiester glycosidase domain-containing protein n=1 Tax=Pararhizobium antarcticum TaxID=1798805 RepID=A0A657LYG2_9HYPH|nr:phosphodiester glycosidase family protein [Pararhizobium antarcticum]OJF91938.1 hypothetical protein AX761_05465 [Rhizobium sp. 58]OJF98321.1 hypothetical protein AX760_14525 [Pararhizobium antarcticum]
MIILAGFLAGGKTADAACRHIAPAGGDYTICSFDPASTEIRTYNKDRRGVPYRSFKALADDLRFDRETMVFAVNGGMYHADLSPVGLFTEVGIEKQPISTKAGWGNFHLLPNGVFFVVPGKAGVLETGAFLKAGLKPIYATQSGPMLVIDGVLHPRFLADSDSLKIRNGVGIDRDGIVHFVVSNGPVRFYDFAVLFRDRLDCPNALFLDGSISSLFAPDIGRHDRIFPMGPIIAVVERRR